MHILLPCVVLYVYVKLALVYIEYSKKALCMVSFFEATYT